MSKPPVGTETKALTGKSVSMVTKTKGVEPPAHTPSAKPADSADGPDDDDEYDGGAVGGASMS